MHLGVQVPSFTFSGGPAAIRATLRDIAQAAEGGGFYSLWVMDHFFQMEMLGGPNLEMLEGYTTLGYFAALTERIRLGTLVTGVIYRHPGILIKTVTTLDTLSGGRAYLGIGAAWYEREARGLGVPYPPTAERFARLEETLRIVHHAWSNSAAAPFNGTYYTLTEPLINPLPLAQPHPPIMIGGMGEHKTLRMVAQYADACNLFLSAGPDVLRNKLDALRRHCDALDRDYTSIEKTALGTLDPAMTAAEVIAQCRQAAALGFTHMIYNMPHVERITPLEALAQAVIPEIAAL